MIVLLVVGIVDDTGSCLFSNGDDRPTRVLGHIISSDDSGAFRFHPGVVSGGYLVFVIFDDVIIGG